MFSCFLGAISVFWYWWAKIPLEHIGGLWWFRDLKIIQMVQFLATSHVVFYCCGTPVLVLLFFWRSYPCSNFIIRSYFSNWYTNWNNCFISHMGYILSSSFWSELLLDLLILALLSFGDIALFNLCCDSSFLLKFLVEVSWLVGAWCVFGLLTILPLFHMVSSGVCCSFCLAFLSWVIV